MQIAISLFTLAGAGLRHSLSISKVIKSPSDQLGSDITLRAFSGEIYFSTPETGVSSRILVIRSCPICISTLMNIKIWVARARFITKQQNLGQNRHIESGQD